MPELFGNNYNNIGTTENPIYRSIGGSGGASASGLKDVRNLSVTSATRDGVWFYANPRIQLTDFQEGTSKVLCQLAVGVQISASTQGTAFVYNVPVASDFDNSDGQALGPRSQYEGSWQSGDQYKYINCYVTSSGEVNWRYYYDLNNVWSYVLWHF